MLFYCKLCSLNFDSENVWNLHKSLVHSHYDFEEKENHNYQVSQGSQSEAETYENSFEDFNKSTEIQDDPVDSSEEIDIK